MTDNTTDSDVFINTYLRKQEEFGTEQIRKRLELEVRFAILEQAYKEKQKECNEAQTALSQAITGLQAVTVERDDLKEELSRVLMSLSEANSTNINNVYKINQLEDKLKEAEALKVDLDIVRNNYSLVCEQLEEVQAELKPRPPSPTKKKKQESEWIDGNEAQD